MAREKNSAGEWSEDVEVRPKLYGYHFTIPPCRKDCESRRLKFAVPTPDRVERFIPIQAQEMLIVSESKDEKIEFTIDDQYTESVETHTPIKQLPKRDRVKSRFVKTIVGNRPVHSTPADEPDVPQTKTTVLTQTYIEIVKGKKATLISEHGGPAGVFV